MAIKKKMLQAAAGAGGAGLDITDVFSTYLYAGNGSTQTITNGIDLLGEGGLVWTKGRSLATNHSFIDTERGATQTLSCPSTAVSGVVQTVTAFNSNGFSVGTDGNVNSNGYDFSSWTFRKAEKFFDVVTYSGDSVAGRTVSHNLGSVPGMMIVKTTSGLSGGFSVYHRSNTAEPATERLFLNQSLTTSDNNNYWNDTAPTSTEFTLGGSGDTNFAGTTYVAYLFAHNDGDGEFGPDSDQDIIKCGEVGIYSNTVNFGWEPQWILFKRANGTSDWYIYDTMRGLTYNFNGVTSLLANTTAAESAAGGITPITNGFISNLTGSYIYMAIRRGPLAPPEAGSEVFGVNYYTGNGATPRLIANSGSSGIVDTVFVNSVAGNTSHLSTRKTGQTSSLVRNSTSTEATHSSRFLGVDNNSGFYIGNNGTHNAASSLYAAIMFTRAPLFFDHVEYRGTTSNTTIAHSLEVAPEMMWIKNKGVADPWAIYYGDNTAYLSFNTALPTTDDATYWNDTTPTSSVFTLGTNHSVNANNENYSAFLFATLDGVSKVGTYTGNGSSQTINCGFTSGARYILIKRLDDPSNTQSEYWYEFNSGQGIVSGNETGFIVNGQGSPFGDIVDPASTGFIVNQTTSQRLNVNNSTYIFYAIA